MGRRNRELKTFYTYTDRFRPVPVFIRTSLSYVYI